MNPNLCPLHMTQSVAVAFDVPVTFAITQIRTNAFAYARFALFKLLRTHKRLMTLQAIGDLCGNRGHDTVILGIKRANELIQTEPAFKEAYERAEQSILNPNT